MRGHSARVEWLDHVVDSDLATGVDGLVPDSVLGGSGRDLEVAAVAIPGVDALGLAELPDPGDRLPRRFGDRDRGGVAPALAHVLQ